LPQPVRIPDEIRIKLQQIRLSLELEYMTATPTIQDMITVALQRFLEDWDHPDSKEKLLKELLEQRESARSRMGNFRR
jgi:hypothetical protein